MYGPLDGSRRSTDDVDEQIQLDRIETDHTASSKVPPNSRSILEVERRGKGIRQIE